MSQPVRHLHRDYSTAHCGKDISHLLATLDENEATCKACQTGLVQFRKDEAAAAAKAQQEREAEEARRLEEGNSASVSMRSGSAKPLKLLRGRRNASASWKPS
jgi:hypothetical protein